VTPLSGEELEAEVRDAMTHGRWAEVEELGRSLDRLDNRPPPPLVGAALWYAEQGLLVFALMPLSKRPYPRSRGFKDATTDTVRIIELWDRLPGSNIGIATGTKVDVIDFDGQEAHRAWSKLAGATWGGERVLGTVSTPRPGGLHVYVPTTGDPNKAGLLTGVDYRGAGGYVLAPPSVLGDRDDQHPGTYRWLRPLRPTGPPYE
jgi:hypothetical protein